MIRQNELLKEVSDVFLSETSFSIIIGAELEFYLKSPICNSLKESIIKEADSDLLIPQIDNEKGNNQYEIQFAHTSEISSLAEQISSVREKIIKICKKFDNEAIFDAKPYNDDYGNSMHIHFSLLDENGENPLSKNGEDESIYMQHSIGGMLNKMQDSLRYFCPTKQCYDRLDTKYMAPSTVSWGGNNRTVALRLPTTTNDPKSRRIEHRVPSAIADPQLCIFHIISAALHGINNKIIPKTSKTHGDASLEQYGHTHLIRNYLA
ncbi:hypothetical protein N9W34_06375 [Rickettsiales bacterium]|nr:hypothetical protein [Rickettsiales bacterium]